MQLHIFAMIFKGVNHFYLTIAPKVIYNIYNEVRHKKTLVPMGQGFELDIVKPGKFKKAFAALETIKSPLAKGGKAEGIFLKLLITQKT